MKFLLASPFTEASGSAIRFWNIAQALSERGHKVVYTDRRAKRVGRLYRCESVSYYGCPSSGLLVLDIAISFFFTSLILLRHLDCSVFYALKPGPNNCVPAFLARLLGKTIILDVDDLDYAYLSDTAGRRLFRFFFDHFPRLFHLVTYHTPRLRDYLVHTARVPESRLYYLAQGVSPVFLTQHRRMEPPAEGSLIYVATLGITSDFTDLIPGFRKLFAGHDTATLSIVGDGSRKAEFERLVADAGIGERVRFAGTIGHAALPRFIASHRIGINYLRPSQVNQCRAILKIREYLACGLEVVCNDVGDAELFEEFVHLEHDIDALFGTIAALLEKPWRPNAAGQAFIERYYQWSTIIGAFEERMGAL